MTLFTDQPGRLVAVCIFAPILLYKGYLYKDIFLICFGILLFIWDLYWLLLKDPCVSTAFNN